MEKTAIEQTVEAIITHPKETMTIDDLRESIPDGWDRKKIYNQLLAARQLGYLEPVGRGVYKILKHDPHETPTIARAAVMSRRNKAKDPAPPTEAPQGPGEISMAKLGLAVYGYIGKLKEKIRELSEAYSYIQGEMRKEQESVKITLNELQKALKEARAENEILRNRIRKDSGKTFSLGELANFK